MKRDAYPYPGNLIIPVPEQIPLAIAPEPSEQIQFGMIPEPRIEIAGAVNFPLRVHCLIKTVVKWNPSITISPIRIVYDQRLRRMMRIPNVQSMILATSAGQSREPPSAMLPKPTHLEK